uniref:Uncharacterized protein n=1 Tax=Magallana gigas TaxID=29159 RepID=K1R229_MAGGI
MNVPKFKALPLKPLLHRSYVITALNNVKRQGKRRRVSYSAVTTQRHLRSSRWGRLEYFRTPCDGAHFEHSRKVRAVALRSDKHAVEA